MSDDDKLAAPNRHKFYVDENKLVYEWEQTLEEVNIFIPVSSELKTKEDLSVEITGKTIEIKKKKKKKKIGDEDCHVLPKLELYRQTIADESVWTRDQSTGEMHIQLVKLKKAEPWEAAFKEHCRNNLRGATPNASDETSTKAEADEKIEMDRRRMMLARFQKENPGFDFSDAEFEVGKEVPDASEWNLKYTTNTVHMLSSTDDDDDASWSNLGTDLQGEEIVFEDVLEGIEDAWEGKDEEVRAWLELAEAQFDARTSPLIGAQQKQQTSHATTTKYETPTQGEGGEGPVQEKQPRRENKRRRTNAMKTLKRSLDVKLMMSSVVSICIGIVALYLATMSSSTTRDVVITENTPSETNSFEERLKAIEEIQRCEVKLEKAKEKVEELVTKILEEKRKLRAQQQRGVFASWLAFEDDEYSEAISSWTAMVAVVTYFTAISMISLWFWKLVNLAFFGNGEMEESSFFTTTTGTTRSDESGSAKDDDDGKGERPIDSYAKVARHLNANKTPTSSIRGALRTPSDSGVPKPFATSSQRRRSVSPTVSKDGATPLSRLPRYKTPQLPPTANRRGPAREDSVNNLGRRMQDVADEDLAMNLYGEQ
ncbi:unnamed protein product [Bathycoccus prasinos]